jgi:hypothetical protein
MSKMTDEKFKELLDRIMEEHKNTLQALADYDKKLLCEKEELV